MRYCVTKRFVFFCRLYSAPYSLLCAVVHVLKFLCNFWLFHFVIIILILSGSLDLSFPFLLLFFSIIWFVCVPAEDNYTSSFCSIPKILLSFHPSDIKAWLMKKIVMFFLRKFKPNMCLIAIANRYLGYLNVSVLFHFLLCHLYLVFSLLAHSI